MATRSQVVLQPAFVLSARPFRETSLLLECLSRDHGRVGLIARGAGHDNAPCCRCFSRCCFRGANQRIWAT
ncbi:MAG: DNA repair protein RecO [Panacagrimonas sp.]